MSQNNADKKQNTANVDIIYVDLDALLDTRLGTLAVLSENYAANALDNGYLKRIRDEFTDVSYDVFKIAYQKRNVETLQHSTFTNVFLLLQSIIKSTFETASSNGNVSPLRIQVNVKPYDLTDDEKAAISQAVSIRLKEMIDVEVVDVPDEFLTPQYCKDTYAMMIRYEYESWFKIHLKAFEHVKMPGVSLLAPALYQTVPTDQEMMELKEKNMHPFMAAEFGMAPFISLKLLDVEVFSIHGDILKAAVERHTPQPEKDKKSDDGIKPGEDKSSEPMVEKTIAPQSDDGDGFELI